MTTESAPLAHPQTTSRIADTAVSREVASLWPHIFGLGVFVQLSINIDKAMATDAKRRGSELTRAKIRLYVGWHVRRPDYLKAATVDCAHYGIDHEADTTRVIAAVHAAYAEEKLQAVLHREDGPSGDDPDGEEGICWRNGLDRRERAMWTKAAGCTGMASDAWRAFKGALNSLS